MAYAGSRGPFQPLLTTRSRCQVDGELASPRPHRRLPWSGSDRSVCRSMRSSDASRRRLTSCRPVAPLPFINWDTLQHRSAGGQQGPAGVRRFGLSTPSTGPPGRPAASGAPAVGRPRRYAMRAARDEGSPTRPSRRVVEWRSCNSTFASELNSLGLACRCHYRPLRGTRRRARRMVSDSSCPICSTKYLSTRSGRPPPASAVLMRRALRSSRVIVA